MLTPLVGTSAGNPIEHQTAIIQAALQSDPDLALNMRMESGLWQSDEERAFYMDSRNAAQEFSQEAWLRLQETIQLHADWFNRFHSNGDESARYIGAEQLSDIDRAMIFEEGRKPYEFDFITEEINHLVGEQIANRTEWNAVPLLPSLMPEQQQADAANHLLKWTAQANRNQWQQSATQVYKDGLVRGMGVLGVGLNPDDPMGAIRLKRARPQEFIWDIASTEDGQLNGTASLTRRYTRRRTELAWEYREWMVDILQMSPNLSTGYGTYDFFYNMMQPRVGASTNRIEQPVQFNPTMQTIWGGRLPVCEHYVRRKVSRWVVFDGIADKTYSFDNQQNAIAARQMLFNFWTQSGSLQQMGLRAPALSAVMPNQVTVLDRYDYIGTVMVRVRSEEYPEFPYKFFIPDWYDGTMVSRVERVKPRQRLVNRLMSHMDQMASGMKAQGIVNKAYLSDKLTDEEIQLQFTEPGKMWIVDQTQPNFDISRVLHVTQVPNVGPVILPLLNLVSESVKGAFGGNVQTGTPDYSGQSGTSQEALLAAGGVSRMYLHDAFRIFTEQVGKSIIYYGQFLDPTTRMRVINESGKADITSFDQSGILAFGDLGFEVLVAEKSVNPSEQSRRFAQFMALAGQMPENAPDFMPLILKYIDIPFNDKQEVMQNMQARQQQQSQLAERAQQLSEQAQLTKDAVQKGNLMIKAAELDILARNPVRWNGQVKIPGTPELLEAMMRQGGIDASAVNVAASLAGKSMMDQATRDMAQLHENQLMTPDQRTLIAAKASQAKVAASSQKDQVARSLKGDENIKD